MSVDNRCALPLSSPDGGSAEGCFLDGDGSPQCAEVFGLGLSFPNPPADSDARFVYNCGLDMIPARANTDGQTECAPDPQACKFSDIEAVFETLEKKNRVSLQFDACRAKGWRARHSLILGECYCNIASWDKSESLVTKCPPPFQSSVFSVSDGNFSAAYHFGPTLQHLPEWTAERADACFVSHCQEGKEPSGFNMNGETECREAAVCAGAATLNAAANVCECVSPNVGTGEDCKEASAEVCAGLSAGEVF